MDPSARWMVGGRRFWLAMVGLAVLQLLGCGRHPVERQQRGLTGLAPSFALVHGFAKPIQCPGRLLEAADGSFYGTACAGGANGMGGIFKRLADGSIVMLHEFSGGDGSEPSNRLVGDPSTTLYGSTRSGGANGVGTLFSYSGGILTTLASLTASVGQTPSAVTLGSDGALYGTAETGGANGYGTIFQWSAGAGLTVLYSFNRTTGSYPSAGVIEGSDGAFYGTCDSDGTARRGTLFQWKAGTGLTTLFSFGGGSEGGSPYRGGVVEGSDGALYGTTTNGGANGFGTIFRWSSGTGLTTVHAFNYYNEGGYAFGGVIEGSDGAFYGTTASGAAGRRGGVFRWTAAAGATSLHAFTNASSGYPVDGDAPQWGVVEGSDGALYGTTQSGGADNGVLFKVGTDGSGFLALVRFGETDPLSPSGHLALAPDGSLVGTSRDGGAYAQGTVYRVSGGSATVLHSFNFDDGAAPESGLVLGSDGAYYGTSAYGAVGCGTLFKYVEGSGLLTLHVFGRSTTGCYPYGGVVQASDGAYYGTTAYGGANEAGTLFRWNGTFTKLHDFAPATDGGSPNYNGVIQGADGALYGTTSSSGPNGGGTIFKWDVLLGQLTVLHAFSTSGSQGYAPMAGVVQGTDGAFYGTTSYGGGADLGTLFRWSSGGGLAPLHAFGGADGQYPSWPLIQRGDGMFWGIADTATDGFGVVFQWDPVASAFDTGMSITPAMGAHPSAWLVNGSSGEAYGTTWDGGPKGGGTLFRLSFTDVNPCLTNNGGCDSNATCANNGGSALCTCNSGYSGDGTICTDVNECLTANGGCDSNATCANTPGSRTCACNAGFAGNGLTCSDINECLSGNGGCDSNATCTNTPGSRTCACNSGYSGNGLTCSDINECVSANGGCDANATCTNTPGSRTCTCNSGYAGNGLTCTDINECLTNNGGCDTNATCTNTVGSRTCACNTGYIGDGITCNAVTLASIQVTPTASSSARGTTLQYTATGIYSDSTLQDLTTQVTWSSSAIAIATISNSVGSQGRATAVNVGTATITATLGSVSGSTTLAVTAATLTSIQVTPFGLSVAKGTTLQYTAIGIYSDSTFQDLTTQVTWTSTTTTVATISNTAGSQGRATAVNNGSTTISATSGAVTGSTSLAVTAATLSSIQVNPPTPSIAKGTTLQLTATGIYSDSTVQDLTAQVTWVSSATTVATISNAAGSQGLATAVDVGPTTMTATAGSVSGSTGLVVTAAVLTSIQVTPSGLSVAKGTVTQFTATGTYSDSTIQDLTAQVTWVSSATAVTTISNAVGSQGLATAVDVGSTTITAIRGSNSGSAGFTVTAATLSSIDVTPAGSTIPRGTSIQFTATGIYSDGTMQDLTTQVTWTSSAASVAIFNASGIQGAATGVNTGSTTVTATRGSVSGSTTLTVSAATLVSLDVEPVDPAMAKGSTLQLQAIGTYTDESTQDLTESATWSSSAAPVASVSNAAGSKGRVSALLVGTTTITATIGSVFDTSDVTVTPATLVSIAVTPANPSSPKGTTTQFTATGIYSDSSTQDLTTQVTWNSSLTSVATISNAAGSQGRATAVNPGSTTITATYNSIPGTTNLTVTAATLSSISVTPANPSVARTFWVQMTATGTYSDGTTQNLTTQVTWTSSNTAVATISNAAGTNGRATAVSTVNGSTTTISATLSGTSGSTTLTSTTITLSSIAVTPAGTTYITVGQTLQMTATGTFSDGTKLDITNQVTWTSSRKRVASVSTAGLVTGVRVSNNAANIRAKKGNRTGSATIRVQ